MDRRSIIKGAALAAAIASVERIATAQGMNMGGGGMSGMSGGGGMSGAGGRKGRMALPFGPEFKPGDKPFRIAMIIFNAMTNQDFVGPHDAFARVRVAEIDILAKTMDPITTDSGLRMFPDKTFATAYDQYDLLFIGGGPATSTLMEDPEVIGFLQSRAPKAQYVTSVCSGSLVLGAAGLLKGYKATSHWTSMEVLPILGAIPTHQRVVFDRNRITGGGVTAGIDFGLAVVGKLWGAEYAEILQLGMEYDPQPPYNMGSPEKASPEVKAAGVKMMASVTQRRKETAARVNSKMKLS